MLVKQFVGCCLVGCLSGGAVPTAQAQTGRIARASHGGHLAESAGNFGLPADKGEYIVDSLVRLDDTWARSYNRSRSVSYRASDEELKKAPWQSWDEKVQYRYPWQTTWEESLQELQQRYPQVKLVGFKQPKPSRKKPAGHTQAFPKRPFQYSYWRNLAGVAALGAVGWLLGKKRVA